jgi:hypothetical protein
MNILHERRADRTGAAQPNTGIAFAHLRRPFRKQRDPGELQLHCAGDAVRWPFKIAGLVKFLGVLLILTALGTTVQAASVTLAWNRCTNSVITGYNVHYGGASGTYTNSVDAGNATNVTISGLVPGTTYYFAATAYTALGVESPFSSEISYRVPSSNNLPTIVLTAPANGASYTAPATITLAATVTTNGHSITRVQFYNGATLLGEDTSAPYSYTWSNVGSGNYSLTARVVYDSGSTITSSSGGITVAAVAAVATLWPGTAVPGVVDGGADSAVEMGVKFRSDAAGSITGIRFYKASANTGTHTGNLWSSTGTLLATATFTSETASGWQQVNFAKPVSITANTVYVASYHANNGHFSYTDNYFSANGVDNPPLHALANGVSGGNGVAVYCSSSVFPTGTWNARNYWVDVVWQAGLPEVKLQVTPARQFVLTVTGTIGHTYDILATQDFKTWTVIGTATVGTNGSLNFTDTNAASFSRRFYRTRG